MALPHRRVLGLTLSLGAALSVLLAATLLATLPRAVSRSLACRPGQGAQVRMLAFDTTTPLWLLWELAGPYGSAETTRVAAPPMGFGLVASRLPATPGYAVRDVRARRFRPGAGAERRVRILRPSGAHPDSRCPVAPERRRTSKPPWRGGTPCRCAAGAIDQSCRQGRRTPPIPRARADRTPAESTRRVPL